MANLFYMPTRIENEIRKRIRLCVYAYAYEFLDDPVASDAEFDKLNRQIDLSIRTGNDKMDDWFENEFMFDTGSWISCHPELEKIADLVKYYAKRKF